MDVVPMKEVRLVVEVDDMDFKIKDATFEGKMFNMHGTFDQIANRSMEDPSYCDLLDCSDHNHFEGEIILYRNA
jgi:hypothetical protein